MNRTNYQTFATITRTVEEATEALTAGCGPCQDTLLAAAEAAMPTGTSAVTWSGVIGFEDQMTGDGRFIDNGALRWDTLPIPLRYVEEDTGGHQNAVVVGRIQTIERQAGGKIYATGDIDMDSEEGCEYARKLDGNLCNGISMDLDSVSFEIRVARELLQREEQIDEADDQNEVVPGPVDDSGRVTVIAIGADDEVMVTTDARVRAATGVAIPAFEGARIALDKSLADLMAAMEPTAPMMPAPASLVASAYPVEPPEAWFANPNLPAPTPMQVTAEGRVYGHMAEWGTCHTGNPKGPGVCVTPPYSATDYAYFRTGAVLTAEGHQVPVGQITLDTIHAGDRMSAATAMAHYANTGIAVADITCGEDAHGIWFSGALRPNVSPEQVRVLRASPLSGDWRGMRGNLELIAALAVNVQGFPIPRPHGLVASGSMQTLVASGMLTPDTISVPGTFTEGDLRALKQLAERERKSAEAADAQAQGEAAALAARVEALQLVRRVQNATSMVSINEEESADVRV